MRGKVAKAMRRAARQVAGPYAKERELLEVNTHLKRYPWLIKTRVGADGNPVVIDPGVRETRQYINDPRSVRGLYRAMKKEHRNA